MLYNVYLKIIYFKTYISEHSEDMYI